MTKLILTLVAVAALAACANRPESILASHVPHEKFIHLECPALATKMVDTRAELEKFSKMQDGKANADAAGVLFLGIPFSKFAGDYESDVARLKGEVEAIGTAQANSNCKAPLNVKVEMVVGE